MSAPETPEQESAAASSSGRIDDLCDRFEAVWNRGERPRIEDFLEQAPPACRARLLDELVALEFEYRRLAGEAPCAEEYLQRFPDYTARTEALYSLPTVVFRANTAELVLDESTSQSALTATIASDHIAALDASAESARPAAAGRIGRFQLLRVLGQGAFGTVYLAYDPRLDRKVAIKVPRAGVLVDQTDLDRFLREARAAAQLRHPNIIPVYEVGQHYIAYEYVDGQTLRQVLRSQFRFSHARAAELVSQLARALDYAHSRGIIHRDMKPENVLIDRDQQPHIADFGLARREEGETLYTREGVVLGTPAYMSPEQAAGQPQLVDRRSDVWSLGVMLVELLTGKRPFEGSITQLLSKICHEEPKRPREFDRSIPRDLDTICQKCLAKKLDERYPAAQALADDLDRWRRGEPIQARPIGPLARAWRWTRRNPSLAAALAAVFLTLVVATAVSSSFAIAARLEQRKRALAQVDALWSAAPESLPLILDNLRPDRAEVLPRLENLRARQGLSAHQQSRLAIAVAALLPEKPDAMLLAELLDALLRADAREFLVVRGLLQRHAAPWLSNLWARAGDRRADRDARFRAACALALYDPASSRWQAIADDVTGILLSRNSLELSSWIESLRPVAGRVIPSLNNILQSAAPADEKTLASLVLGSLCDDPAMLVPLVRRADPGQLAALLPRLQGRASQVTPLLRKDLEFSPAADASRKEARQTASDRSLARANAALAILSLGQGDLVWPLLRGGEDPWVRTLLIRRLGPAGVDPEILISRLEVEQDPGILIAILLGLGEYRADQLYASQREDFVPRLLEWYIRHPEPGVHSAIRWLLTRWEFRAALADADARLNGSRPESGQRWQVNSQGQTLAVFRGPVTFVMGSPEQEEDRLPNEVRHLRKIPRSFAVATTEVTVDQYRRFLRAPAERDRHAPEAECPVLDVTWLDAARYCRWLSEQEGVGEDQMCFPPLDKIDPDREIRLPDNVLERTGYRLPTAAEWEYAARAGAATSRFYGDNDSLLPDYAWYARNSESRSQPVGWLKPNDFGLFDVLGNALEWCQDSYFDDYPAFSPEGALVDGTDRRAGYLREIRGGCMFDQAGLVRTAIRDYQEPVQGGHEIGFRVARTILP